MNKSIFTYFFLSTSLLFSACNNNTQEKTTQTENIQEEAIKEIEPLSWEMVSLKEKITPCINDECTKITITYPEFKKDKKSLNSMVRSVINQMIIDHIPPGIETGDNIKQNMTAFIKSYEEFKQAFPESQTPWTVDISAKVSYQTPELTSFRINSESYTGGAHSYDKVSFLNFDEKGRLVESISNLFNDLSRLMVIAEKEFRKSKGLESSQQLSDGGYNFENDKFSLPETFGFSDKGLILYFNSYEIAAYSEGPTELLIPFETIEGLMTL
ncbi:DUF3298 and DUF4163 domain-containing protein [Marinoscillum sp. MHG1-6]|uniref:DUF3298 and DUF4163 domain-containing protein n=1 Tax=Marinoscillum sp. MHG1-6 TaxID=2959627 RepID=UPI00215845AD|nr:DUF3298 and DUF4163 domain-containing protein [Marinoscillum sp. MHG1-6]